MAILVTGGAGFIGSHTCVELLNAGFEIVIVDNFFNSKPEVLKRIRELTNRDFKFYECDIRDRDGLTKIFEENDIEAVIHFAGLKAVGESCRIPLKYYENNITGTIVLCQVMEQANCKKIVFSSSATVYGMKNPSPLREDMETGGVTNPYGWTKFMIEKILADVYNADHDWSVSLLRYFNPIGAHKSGRIGEDPNGIPNNLMPYISQVAIGKLPELSVFGNDFDTHDGTGVRDYIHVVDLALGHICAVRRALQTTGVDIYNLGTGVGYSVLDIVNSFEKVNQVKVPYKIVGRRDGDIATCYADASKALKELGWKTERGIDEMCEDTWRWQTQNPNGYN